MSWKRVLDWLLVRQGEEGLVLHLALSAILLGGGMAIGRGSSDALFFKRFGTEYLPHMFLATGFLLMLTSWAYARVADLWRPGKSLLAMCAVIAGLLGFNWLFMQFSANLYAYAAYFLIYAVASEILVAHFSHFANSFFDVRQNKRLAPLINAATRVGAILGGLLLGALSQILPLTSLALVWALVLALSVVAVLWMAHHHAGVMTGTGGRASRQVGGMMKALYFTRRSRLLRITSLGAFLLIILVSLQDYVVAIILTGYFKKEEDLTTFFGLFFALSNALVLVLQMALTNRLLHRYGLRAVNMIFPISTFFTFALLAAVPGIVTATLGRFNYMGMLPAFRIPVASLFYKALPEYMHGRARALTLGLVLPAGLVVAGLGQLFIPSEQAVVVLPVVGVVLSAWMIWVKLRKNAAYSESLTGLIQQQVFSERGNLLDEDLCLDQTTAQKIADDIARPGEAASIFMLVDMLVSRRLSRQARSCWRPCMEKMGMSPRPRFRTTFCGVCLRSTLRVGANMHERC